VKQILLFFSEKMEKKKTENKKDYAQRMKACQFSRNLLTFLFPSKVFLRSN